MGPAPSSPWGSPVPSGLGFHLLGPPLPPQPPVLLPLSPSATLPPRPSLPNARAVTCARAGRDCRGDREVGAAGRSAAQCKVPSARRLRDPHLRPGQGGSPTPRSQEPRSPSSCRMGAAGNGAAVGVLGTDGLTAPNLAGSAEGGSCPGAGEPRGTDGLGGALGGGDGGGGRRA